jgi:hypothetical protein
MTKQKKIHNFANQRRISNIISEIKDFNGSRVSSFEGITKARTEFSSSLFRSPLGCLISKILKVVKLFPRFFNEYLNAYLLEDISKKEILDTLSYFQKYKIPSPDSFTVEFFLGFYDFLKSDILKVVT